MQISLSKAYAIIDDKRGKCLHWRSKTTKGTPQYEQFSYALRILNALKKEFALVSDADQLPLGL
jgi:hypothetical protein